MESEKAVMRKSDKFFSEKNVKEISKIAALFEFKDAKFLFEKLNRLPSAIKIYKKTLDDLPRNKQTRNAMSKLAKHCGGIKDILQNLPASTLTLINAFSYRLSAIAPVDLKQDNSKCITRFEEETEIFGKIFLHISELITQDVGGQPRSSIPKFAIWWLANAFQEGTDSSPQCQNYRDGSFQGDFFEFLTYIKDILLEDMNIDLGAPDTIGQYACQVCKKNNPPFVTSP